MTADRMASRQQLAEPKLTVEETAKILEVSKMTVYRLTKSEGGFPPVLRHYRVGRQIKIPLSVVRTYLAACQTGEWPGDEW
jgi:excisionase family DNA binding protein